MTADEALYDVREQTGNPAHASVDDVVKCFISSHECAPSCGVLPAATPDVSAVPMLAATQRECIRKRR